MTLKEKLEFTQQKLCLVEQFYKNDIKRYYKEIDLKLKDDSIKTNDLILEFKALEKLVMSNNNINTVVKDDFIKLIVFRLLIIEKMSLEDLNKVVHNCFMNLNIAYFEKDFTLVDKDRKESFNKLLIYSGIVLYF